MPRRTPKRSNNMITVKRITYTVEGEAYQRQQDFNPNDSMAHIMAALWKDHGANVVISGTEIVQVELGSWGMG